MDNFLYKGQQPPIAQFALQEEFLNTIKNNPDIINNDLLRDAASNLVPFKEEGREILHEIARNYAGYDEGKINWLFDQMVELHQQGVWATTYEKIALHGFTPQEEPEFRTPANEVLARKRLYDLKVRGFSYDDKGNLKFNGNDFIDYALTRVKLCQLGEGNYFIYNRNGYWEPISEIMLSRIFRHIMHEAQRNIWRKSYASEYMEVLKVEVSNVVEMDNQREFINLENGMLNIFTLKLYPHEPKYYSTIRIPVKYNPDANCPRFKQFLEEIFEGDQERIQLVWELIGYFLTSETRIQMAFIFFGVGANGKSLLAEILTYLCGRENVANVPISELGTRFGLQNLPGKTLNISTENELSNKYINTQNFKAITGSDTVNVEQKYKTAYSCRLTCKLLALLNNLPNTDDKSYGYYRRLLIIPFNRSFKGEEADKNLLDKLLQELEGILAYALRGLQALVERDYNLPKCKAADEALQQYMYEQNPVLEFFEDCIEVVNGESIKRTKVHDAFFEWCITNGHKASKFGTQQFWNLFKRVLQDRNIPYQTKKIKGTIYLDNIKVVNNVHPVKSSINMFLSKEDIAGQGGEGGKVINEIR